jgi:hypothetical protein
MAECKPTKISSGECRARDPFVDLILRREPMVLSDSAGACVAVASARRDKRIPKHRLGCFEQAFRFL